MKAVIIALCLGVVVLGMEEMDDYLDQFNSFDINGDDKVTPEDFEGMFKHLDENDDHFVDITEYLTRGVQDAVAATNFFEEVDKDNDNLVSAAEVQALFELIDINSDAIISLEEYQIYHHASYERLRASES